MKLYTSLFCCYGNRSTVESVSQFTHTMWGLFHCRKCLHISNMHVFQFSTCKHMITQWTSTTYLILWVNVEVRVKLITMLIHPKIWEGVACDRASHPVAHSMSLTCAAQGSWWPSPRESWDSWLPQLCCSDGWWLSPCPAAHVPGSVPVKLGETDKSNRCQHPSCYLLGVISA